MPQTAIDMLKEDHQKVKNLLEQLVGTTDRAEKTRKDLLQKIEHEVTVHSKLEEEIFYPAFRDAAGKDFKKIYFAAVEEHRAVEKLVLPDLKKTDVTSEMFAGRAKVLKDLIEHHIAEEESEMFPEAEKVLDSETLKALGGQMQERKQQLLK